MAFVETLNSIPVLAYVGAGLVIGLVVFGFIYLYKPKKQRRRKGDRHDF